MVKTDIIGEHMFRRRRGRERRSRIPFVFAWPLRIAISQPKFGLEVAKTVRWQSALDAHARGCVAHPHHRLIPSLLELGTRPVPPYQPSFPSYAVLTTCLHRSPFQAQTDAIVNHLYHTGFQNGVSALSRSFHALPPIILFVLTCPLVFA